MTEELKPCPFCGEDCAFVITEDRVWIECADCPSKAEVGPFNTVGEAETAWNTRAPSPDMAEAVGLIQRLGEGWDNAVELGLIPERHRNTAQILGDEARAFLARVGAA